MEWLRYFGEKITFIGFLEYNQPCEYIDLNEDLPHDYLGDVVHVRFNLLISKPDHGGNPGTSGTE